MQPMQQHSSLQSRHSSLYSTAQEKIHLQGENHCIKKVEGNISLLWLSCCLGSRFASHAQFLGN